MGYRVRIFPANGRSGFLEWGRLAPSYGKGTYYPHPSNAHAAAERWVKRHPGGRAQIEVYSSGEIVSEIV